MSIIHELGLDTRSPEQVAIARWSDWAEQQPALRAVTAPENLEQWLSRPHKPRTSAQYDELDAVVRGLASLAAQDGGDDQDAAYVLAWAMLPAAVRVARSLPDPPPTMDQVVAHHLWVLVRTFRWQHRRGNVAANISRDLRASVLRELDRSCSRSREPISVIPTDPNTLDLFPDLHVVPTSPDEELDDLLQEGCATGAITPADDALLRCLLEVVRRRQPPHKKSRAAGLLTATVTAEVAQELGISSRHVRRRTTAAIAALARVGRSIA